MADSHVNHLGRKTSETFWILQDELAMGIGSVLARDPRNLQSGRVHFPFIMIYHFSFSISHWLRNVSASRFLSGEDVYRVGESTSLSKWPMKNEK
jgi:hypothetical protein